MFTASFITFVDLFVLAFTALIALRVLLSFIPEAAASRFGRMLFDLTEPVLAPVRRLLPKSQMIDWSPLVTFLLLQLIQWALHSLIA